MDGQYPSTKPRSASGHEKTSVYAGAIRRYLTLLGAACGIASLFVGPGMILVWIVTAIVLTWEGSHSGCSHHKSKRRKAGRF